MRFLQKLWRGEYSLPRMFWLGLILGSLALSLVFAFGVAFTPRPVVENLWWLLRIIVLAYPALLIVLMVGTWRSASRYQSLHDEQMRRVFGILAKIPVAMMMLVFAYYVFLGVRDLIA